MKKLVLAFIESNPEKIGNDVSANISLDNDTLGGLLGSDFLQRRLTHGEEVRLGSAIVRGRQMAKAVRTGEMPQSELINKIIQQGKLARSCLITANTKLALSVSKLFRNISTLDYRDLVQEGIIGLMLAVDRYDHKKGLKFSTYAVWWIRQRIHRAIANTGATVRLPVYMKNKVFQYRRARIYLESADANAKVSITKIAKKLGWNLEQTQFIQQISEMRTLSLETPIKSGESGTIEDNLASSAPRASQVVDDKTLSVLVSDLLNELPSREADVLQRRFGFGDKGIMETLEEIGKDYGVSRERVRQIESSALSKMMHPSRAEKLAVFFTGKNDL